jgi:hypothetical protein
VSYVKRLRSNVSRGEKKKVSFEARRSNLKHQKFKRQYAMKHHREGEALSKIPETGF